MPIKLPKDFPARKRLLESGINSLEFERAENQEIRPLRIVLFNLMPTKVNTETQILRLLSTSSIQIEPYFLKTESYQPTHFSKHLDRFYINFSDIKDKQFDALIITGAPVEEINFEDVKYWDEFVEIKKWANKNVFATLHICWGASAGLYVDFGIEKIIANKKLFGIFPYQVLMHNRLTAGFDDTVMIPQSRWFRENHQQLRKAITGGKLMELVGSTQLQTEDNKPLPQANILATPNLRKSYILGHLEYTRNTLLEEYLRDVEANKENITVPENYFYNNEPGQKIAVTWSSTARIFFINWIDFIYQETPYNLKDL
ncbi:MAG: homoserine O-succinyltransferase [Candidatus Ancillula sp.]|jgi:homoserine O-succinyltransferase|nr:homoserine O-succinyltransferase [Candidatus Ancillula sp.]